MPLPPNEWWRLILSAISIWRFLRARPDYVSRASMTLAQPVKLVSVQPHMHHRGKAMEVRAVYPDGERKLLISVPKYDFNWQTTYVLREPLLLPAGTRLESVAHFDNSVNNPSKPDRQCPSIGEIDHR